MTNKARQKALIKCIKEQDRVIEAAEREIERIKNSLIELAPHKIGDHIPSNDWSYRGKNLHIDSISVRCSGGEFEYCYYGRVVKADGTPGERNTRAFHRVLP